MKFINLLKKELSELINAQMILSLVVAMGIFMVLGSIMDTTIDDIKEETSNVTVRISDRDDTDYTRSLLKSIEDSGNKIKRFDTSGDDYAAILNDNGIKDIIIIPEGFTDTLDSGEKPELLCVARMTSAATMSNLNVGSSSGIQLIRDQVAADLAKNNGLTPEQFKLLDSPIAVVDNTVVDDRSAAVSPDKIMSKIAIQNMMLPIIVFILITMTSQMLMSAVANEKTDKTLETLLSAPVSRGSVIGAKMLAAAIIALINAGVYMIGFSVFVSGASTDITSAASGIIGETLSVDEAISKLGLSLGGFDYFLVGLQLFFTIMICLSVSLILGALVNDTKNTQTMIMPILLMAMIPYMISMLADINSLPIVLRYIVYAIPFTHTFSAIPNLMFGNRLIFFAGLIYQIIVFSVCMFLALRIFMSDRIFTIRLNFGQKSKYKSRKRKEAKK